MRATMRSPIQGFATLYGVIFLAVGILGFVPGITQNFGRLDVYDAPGATLLGIFAVNWVHNVAHILFGVAGLSMAGSYERARSFFLVGGALYLGLWLFGILIDKTSSANFIALNTADNWLHLFLGASMVLIGAIFGRSAVIGRASSQRHQAA